MAVQAMIELGHNANVRQQQTAEGYTHDWLVFVRGCNREPIDLFIEKVVFQLHDSFPKPKRVRHEPPYEVRESGYAGFLLPIVIHFRDGECLTLHHDLILKNEEPTQCARQVKLTFPAPTDKFRRLLMRAGGVTVSSVDQDASHSPRQRSSAHGHSSGKSKSGTPTSANPSAGSADRKSKSQSHTSATSGANRSKHCTEKKGDKPPVNRVKEQFLNLFGTPIKKLSKDATSSATTKQSSKSPDDRKKKVSKETKSGDAASSAEKDRTRLNQSSAKEQKEKRSSKEGHRDKADKKHGESKQSRVSSKYDVSGRNTACDVANKAASVRYSKDETAAKKLAPVAEPVDSLDYKSNKHDKTESCDADPLRSSSKLERKLFKEKKTSKKESKDATNASDNAELSGSKIKKESEQFKHKPRDEPKAKSSLERLSSPKKCHVDPSESTSKTGKSTSDCKKDKKIKRKSDEFSKGVAQDRGVSDEKTPSITVKLELPFKEESTFNKAERHRSNIGSSVKKETDSVSVEVSSDSKSSHKTSQRNSKAVSDVLTKHSKKSRKRPSNGTLNDVDNKSKKSKSSDKNTGLSPRPGARIACKDVPNESVRSDVDDGRVSDKRSAQRRIRKLHVDCGKERISSAPTKDPVASATDRPSPTHKRRERSPSGSESGSDAGMKTGCGSTCWSSASSSASPSAPSTASSKQNPLRRLMNEVSSASELSPSDPPSPPQPPPSSSCQQRRRVPSSSSCASSSSLLSSSSSSCLSDCEKRVEKHQQLSRRKRKKRSTSVKQAAPAVSPEPASTADRVTSPSASAAPPASGAAPLLHAPDTELLTPSRDLSIFTTEYLAELQHLQRRIMSSRDSDELGRVFDLINATGLIEDNPNYYDFDLCALDQSVVRKLQQCLLMV